jgi:hypothetical protein
MLKNEVDFQVLLFDADLAAGEVAHVQVVVVADAFHFGGVDCAGLFGDRRDVDVVLHPELLLLGLDY